MSQAGRVLVVDPEPIVVELVLRRLRAAGFETSSASTLREASSLAAAGAPDVVLLAASLPDATGLQALSRLRALPGLEGVSIALVTAAQRDAATLDRAIALGADDYLRKPIDPVELVARVRALLRLRRQIAELRLKTARLEELNAELERTAIRDGLTGVYNRRYFELRLGEELERARRYGHALGLVVADVDHFKKVNDTFGHVIGDAVLRSVAATLQGSIRGVDLLARYGGEEFVLLLPSTDLAGASLVADRLRALVSAAPVMTTNGSGAHAAVRVTSSFGVAATRPGAPVPTPVALVERADEALYRAKAGGRNRVELAELGSDLPAPAAPGQVRITMR